MKDGLLCPGCLERHDDYERVAKHAVYGVHHRGVAHVYECGRCGERSEVLFS